MEGLTAAIALRGLGDVTTLSTISTHYPMRLEYDSVISLEWAVRLNKCCGWLSRLYVATRSQRVFEQDESRNKACNKTG